MSHARRVLKGSTVAVVRRCSERRFFLRPSKRLNRKIRFLLAVYAQRHGIQLHAFVFMGNHYHLLLTDTRRRLPRFMEELNNMLTRVINKDLGRSGRLWGAGSYAHWDLHTRQEVLQNLVYLATNPVEAWIVRDPSRWPGLISLPNHAGTPRRATPPPRGLFDRGHADSALPEFADLQLHVPPAFKRDGLRRYQQLFQRALDARLTELHARRGRYTGARSALRKDPFSAPKGSQAPSFSLIPALTNADKQKRQELKEWRRAVRAAFYRWQAGKRNVEFPQGTWHMVERHRARVVPA